MSGSPLILRKYVYLIVALLVCVSGPATVVMAAPFTVGNLLVAHGNTLHEYTLGRTLVQSIAVPHPDTSRYDVYDAVYDRFGRAHVVNYAPFSNSYISTYDPLSASWTHTLAPLAIGNVSDGDLSIIGDKIFARDKDGCGNAHRRAVRHRNVQWTVGDQRRA